jgi:pimeloyl-ACP methyl ester carboxylesterase
MKSTSTTTSTGGGGDARAPTAVTRRRVWTDTATGRIHARVGGEALDGLPVLLVHGMVISGRYMVPTALELAPLCPVYAVDLPGYGDSGLVPISEWRSLFARVGKRGDFVGVDESAFPRDFGVFVRYHFDFHRKISARHASPPVLT